MKLKIWELSLITALVLAVLCGFLLENDAHALSDKVLRLHVLANSDSEADQALKLHVRDAVLAELETLIGGASDRGAAEEIIGTNLDSLQEIAQNVVWEAGASYGALISLTEERFPTRIYDTFSLPAGVYTALRIELGGARGQNWWCVVFPPLCAAPALGELYMEESGLTEEEVSLITGEDTGYVIKFKALEILDQVKDFFN